MYPRSRKCWGTGAGQVLWNTRAWYWPDKYRETERTAGRQSFFRFNDDQSFDRQITLVAVDRIVLGLPGLIQGTDHDIVGTPVIHTDLDAVAHGMPHQCFAEWRFI